jgi:hypothetical protein
MCAFILHNIFLWIWLVSHFHKPTPKMNTCFLHGNPEQTPLARDARVGVAHWRREEAWRLPVRPLEAVLHSYVAACVALYGKLRHSRRLDAVQSGCTALSIVKQGHLMVVANADDSRVVLGTASNDGVITSSSSSSTWSPTYHVSCYWPTINSCALGRRLLLTLCECPRTRCM